MTAPVPLFADLTGSGPLPVNRRLDLTQPLSYLSSESHWEPTLPAAGTTFTLADLITLGGHQDEPDRLA